MTVVDLNVGGIRFTTTIDTLTREPESMLARMFGGELAPCEQDRDGRWGTWEVKACGGPL